MSRRPSRAKMNNWLADQLRGIRIIPFNPMDTAAMAANGKVADMKLRHLASIASELGWSFDASLDIAWELISDYEKEYNSGG